MQISGTGITPFTAKVLPEYKPVTSLAIKWRQALNGNWKGTDRGSSADIYEAEIQLYGKESVIDNFIDEIQANRAADSHVLTLSSFADTEYIFGEDVDHSGSISATIVKFGSRKQATWKGWALDLKLRAISPSFTGSATFPTLEYLDVGPDADRNWTVNKFDSYIGTFSYQDHNRDSGIFNGVFLLSASDMRDMRRYIATQRTGDFLLTDDFGFGDPFGSRSSGAYPYNCKLIEWEDLGLWGVQWRKIRLKFAEIVEQVITGDGITITENLEASIA
jgi:hypothetical protein